MEPMPPFNAKYGEMLQFFGADIPLALYLTAIFGMTLRIPLTVRSMLQMSQTLRYVFQLTTTTMAALFAVAFIMEDLGAGFAVTKPNSWFLQLVNSSYHVVQIRAYKLYN